MRTERALKEDGKPGKGEPAECPEEFKYLTSLADTDRSGKETWKAKLYGYTLMLWDGLGFFGTDHMKLGRLRGEKVNFCTPFKSPRTLLLGLAGLILAIVIIVIEVEKIGKQKSQTVSLVQQD